MVFAAGVLAGGIVVFAGCFLPGFLPGFLAPCLGLFCKCKTALGLSTLLQLVFNLVHSVKEGSCEQEEAIGKETQGAAPGVLSSTAK
jgi:hypothetical protein